MKLWINKALDYLSKSLENIPQELNALDWKESLSPNNDKMTRHLSAFANLPGGGFMCFGINDKTGVPTGIKRHEAINIVEKLSNLARNNVDPVVVIEHTIETWKEKEILIVYIKESAIKPVHISGKSIEECYVRSGSSTRKASRQEIGGLMLNSKTPIFEELHASKLKTALEVITTLDYASILVC